MSEIQFPEKLAFLLTESARLKVLFGGRGAGKCLALGTKVIRFDGSLCAVDDVREGDLLMGPDSKPRKVLGTTRGFSQMYRVSQTSGIDYVVNDAHILSLKKSKSCAGDKGEITKAGTFRRPLGRYPDYPLVTNINVVEAYNKSKRWREHFRGYRAGLISFLERPVNIDPWFLGLWLGDGKSTDTVIYSADDEIIEECKSYAHGLGQDVTIYSQPNNKSVGVNIRRVLGTGKTNPLVQAFKAYGLFGNKHIPQEYVSNSESVRLNVLAGLIDSDGHLNNNGYEIAQTNETLARQIKFLADTLGFRTCFREKDTVCGNNGVKGKAFIVTINGDTWRIPCRLPRKRVNKEDVRKNKDFLLSQIKIEPIGLGEYAGFALDGDKLFLLEDGTVTHNTENIATALLVFARSRKMRIACFRELQKSIDESVYATIENRARDLGWQDEFDFQAKKIIHKRTGSEFIFMGLRYNVNSIKSLARIDIAWVEEAINVSATSWDKLEPSIRGRAKDDPNGMGGPFGKGPEIWVSFNPELDSDETYKRFVLQRDKFAPDFMLDEDTGENVRYAIVAKVNYTDNPFFPPDLRMQMSVLKSKRETDYLNVWEGHTKQVLDGAIYAEELKQVLLEKRRGKVSYDPSRPVHTFWDLGHSDHTAIWFAQQVGVEYNLINYFQDHLKKIPYYLEHLQSLKYNYGTHYLPHDADNETLASRSVFKIVREAYPGEGRVKIVPRVAKKVIGIRAARMIFELCNFDEANTADGWQCLSHYTFAINENGVFSKEPAHNEYSHGADAFQTFSLSLKSETASSKKKPKAETNIVPIRPHFNSWMGG